MQTGFFFFKIQLLGMNGEYDLYVCILHSSSSLSRRAISTDTPDTLPPPFSIVHCFRQVLKVTFCIGTELLYVGSSWSSCLCSSI